MYLVVIIGLMILGVILFLLYKIMEDYQITITISRKEEKAMEAPVHKNKPPDLTLLDPITPIEQQFAINQERNRRIDDER